MKAFLILLGSSLLLCSSLQAGWGWDKQAYRSSKSMVEQRVTSPSMCFDTGYEFSLYMTGFWPQDPRLNNTTGGGVALGYFFGHNLGLEGSYHLQGDGGSGSDIQVGKLNAVYRFPLGGECCSTIAPYIFGGPGVISAGTSEMIWNLGGGIDWRFESWGCVGVFADYSYNWSQGTIPDFTMLRAGIRIPF